MRARGRRGLGRMAPWAGALCGLALACKVEPIEDLAPSEPPPLLLPSTLAPWSTEMSDDASSAARWDETLSRHLAFATSPDLAGRRPGSPGAALTAGFVVSVLQAAGLSPSGPDLGWTQAVGVRSVSTHDRSLTIIPPPSAEKGRSTPAPQRFEDELWLQRRGSAGAAVLRLRLDGQAELPRPTEPTAPVTEGVAEPPLQRLRVLDPEAVMMESSPREAYREAFEWAWRDGVDVAVLPIPSEDAASLAAAERWREPDVQSLLLGRDPPATLALQGFVGPEAHAALLAARDTPGTTVELAYEASEQWFQDDNVIGRIAGGHHPEQVVLVTTHWDEGGLSEPLPGGGGYDNAGSLAVLLSVTEVAGRWRSAGRRPERSIVVLVEAGGSLGHRGVERFIEASGIRPANIVAVVALDRLGGEELRVVDGALSTLASHVSAIDPTARVVDAGDRSYGHSTFLELRVPAVTLTRPPPPDGPTPPPTAAALRRDAELVLRLLWSLADEAEPPRWLGRTEAPPPEAAGSP